MMIVDQLMIKGRGPYWIEGPDPNDAGWDTRRYNDGLWVEYVWFRRRPRNRVRYAPMPAAYSGYSTRATALQQLADMRRMEEISILAEPDYYGTRPANGATQ